MTIDAEIEAVLEGAVLLGDEPTPQEVMLGEAVARQIAERDPEVPRTPNVQPYLAMASTVELLDELRRRIVNEEGT